MVRGQTRVSKSRGIAVCCLDNIVDREIHRAASMKVPDEALHAVDTGTWIGQNLDGKTQKTEYAVYEASIAAGASPWLYSLLPPECHNARVRLLMPVGTPGDAR